MARYSSEHKNVTRQRIIERAGRRFKRDGIDRAGISVLMADASLTNGAFYVHFDSKDDLVCAVLTDQLRQQRGGYGARAFTRETFEQFARDYLSPQHRADHEGGCPSAALLDDVIRSGAQARRNYTVGTTAVIDDIAALIPGEDARARAASIFAAMIGTLQLSRAIDDAELAAAMLRQGLAGVLGLVELHCAGEGAMRASRSD